MSQEIKGFSKLSKKGKIDWLVKTCFKNDVKALHILKKYWNSDDSLQKLHDEFSENTISNFFLPLGRVFLVDLFGRNHFASRSS